MKVSICRYAHVSKSFCVLRIRNGKIKSGYKSLGGKEVAEYLTSYVEKVMTFAEFGASEIGKMAKVWAAERQLHEGVRERCLFTQYVFVEAAIL